MSDILTSLRPSENHLELITSINISGNPMDEDIPGHEGHNTQIDVYRTNKQAALNRVNHLHYTLEGVPF